MNEKARPRILIADGQPDQRARLALALSAAGYRAAIADGAAEALGLLEDPERIDLVVTDIDMPGFGDVDVARAARTFDPHVPILFVTEEPDRVTDRVTAAPSYCLAKPFTISVLTEVAGRLLASRPIDRRRPGTPPVKRYGSAETID